VLPGVFLVVSLGLGRGGEPPAAGAKAAAAGPSAAVRSVYAKRCQRCHEADGTGSDADTPDFTDRRWQKGRTDLQLLVSILDGKGAGMPGFRGKITDEEARELVAFVRAFPAGPAVASDDFASRFRALQDELDALQKQFRGAAGSGRKEQSRR
jgi:mono/diheme cytochrome c family protein